MYVYKYPVDSDYWLQNIFANGFNNNMWLLNFWVTLDILRNYCNLKSNYFDFVSNEIQSEGVVLFIIIE